MRALLAAAAVAVATARFADQVSGERVRKHVGPVTAALHAAGGRTAVVRTAAHVVAGLNLRTGEHAWRVVLPDGAWRRARGRACRPLLFLPTAPKLTRLARARAPPLAHAPARARPVQRRTP